MCVSCLVGLKELIWLTNRSEITGALKLVFYCSRQVATSAVMAFKTKKLSDMTEEAVVHDVGSVENVAKHSTTEPIASTSARTDKSLPSLPEP